MQKDLINLFLGFNQVKAENTFLILKKSLHEVRKLPESSGYYFIQRVTWSCLRVIIEIWEQEGTVICERRYRKLRSLKAICEVADVKRDVQAGKLARNNLLSSITSQYLSKIHCN